MRDEIIRQLGEIEREEDAIILYACESGSRAWGFPSEDSDYDVRFIYLRPRDWYLSIDVEEKRDVIERPIDDLLDISGWDLRKALKLLRKSNPPLLEWLTSPTVYVEKFSTANRLREAIQEFYSPISSRYHYLQMARKNYREYLKGETVRIKKYFYVLRPLLAVGWVERKLGPVPMEFQKLVDKCIESPQLRSAIGDLIERKKRGFEKDRQPKISMISNFIERELNRFENDFTNDMREKPDFEKLNLLFRDAISETENKEGV